MHFVQSAFLLATAAVAIPVIVHLLFRSRARRVNLGTLRFLKQVLERNAQRQRIMRWLLLALRMGAAILLAILFARPYFLEAGPGRDRRLVMVLIDRSASMDLRGDEGRLVEQALAGARRIVADQPEQTRVEIAFFDDTLRPVTAGPTENTGADRGNRDQAARQLADAAVPEAAYHATNYGAAISWARDLAVRIPAPTQELHLFTDLQRSGLDWADVAPLPASVKVHLHDLGRAVVNNLAVIEARPLHAVVRPSEPATVQATLLNSTPFPIAEQPVLLRLESPRGKLSLREKVKLEAGSTGTVRFEIAGLDAGLWQGTVSVETDDDLRFDNARQVAILAGPPSRVLLADGSPAGSSILSETYFLSAALRLAGQEEAYADAPFDATVEPYTADDPLPAINGCQVVVLANVQEIRPEDAERLATFVRAGGGLVVFGGELVQPRGYEALRREGLVPGRIVGPVHASDLPFRLDQWDEKHPLLRPLSDPQHGDLRRLSFRGYTRILPPETDSLLNSSEAGAPPSGSPAPTVTDTASQPPPTAPSETTPPQNAESRKPADVRVLARFRGGDPALLEQKFGLGTAIWFTSSCDRGWGDWPGSKLYLPVVHQIIGQPLGLNEGGPVRSSLIDTTQGADAVPAVLSRVGFTEVLNPSPRESETDRCTADEFADRFQLTLKAKTGEPLARATAAAAAAAASLEATDLRPDERWPWIVGALAALLLVEAFVANRTVS